MGDGADMALSDVFDDEEARLEYKIGFMSQDEAYDRGLIDELGFLMNAFTGARTQKKTNFRVIHVKPNKTCSMCKKNGLHWQNTENGWRLFESNNFIHDCGRLKV